MIVYVNARTGREIVRPVPDPRLEKSAGWYRVEGVPLGAPEDETPVEGQEVDNGWD